MTSPEVKDFVTPKDKDKQSIPISIICLQFEFHCCSLSTFVRGWVWQLFYMFWYQNQVLLWLTRILPWLWNEEVLDA